MKHVSQRMSIETVNFENKLIVPCRDSVDLATSHTVRRALRSLGRKLMQETKKFSHFFSWLKAWISVEKFLCSTSTAWYICFSGVGEVIPSSHMSKARSRIKLRQMVYFPKLAFLINSCVCTKLQ